LPHGFKILNFSLDLQAINGKLTSLKSSPETDPLNLVSGEDLSDVNFPLIACRSIEKFEILKPWGNLLLAK